MKVAKAAKVWIDYHTTHSQKKHLTMLIFLSFFLEKAMSYHPGNG